jgi:hypothetical protein
MKRKLNKLLVVPGERLAARIKGWQLWIWIGFNAAFLAGVHPFLEFDRWYCGKTAMAFGSIGFLYKTFLSNSSHRGCWFLFKSLS